MNNKITNVSEQVQIEAASWITQLDKGKLSARDQLALAEWMARSPQHSSTLKQMAKLWEGIDLAFDTVIKANSDVSIWSVVKSWVVVRPMRFASTAVLTLAAIATLSFFLLPNVTSNTPQNYQVFQAAKGDKAIQVLSDGTHIHLNTDTLVEVQYSKTTRMLRLLRGEAFFEVAKDPSRPFHVYAGEARVAAIGTAFSVKLEGESIDVIVSEGKIRFDRVGEISGKTLNQVEKTVKADTPVFMEAGQSMEFENKIQKVAEIDNDILKKKFAWQKGEIIFSGDNLENVVAEMNRYSSKTIVISDKDLRSLRVSGIFKSDDISAILEALELTMGIQVDNSTGNTIYLSK